MKEIGAPRFMNDQQLGSIRALGKRVDRLRLTRTFRGKNDLINKTDGKPLTLLRPARRPGLL